MKHIGFLFILTIVTRITAPGQVVFDEASLNSGMKHYAVASDFMGAAVAVFDYNNDGWQDIYLTGGIEPDKLFKNLGHDIFKDATAEAGGFKASITHKTTSVITADLDNDGYREIIVGSARDMPSFIYKNNKTSVQEVRTGSQYRVTHGILRSNLLLIWATPICEETGH